MNTLAGKKKKKKKSKIMQRENKEALNKQNLKVQTSHKAVIDKPQIPRLRRMVKNSGFFVEPHMPSLFSEAILQK